MSIGTDAARKIGELIPDDAEAVVILAAYNKSDKRGGDVGLTFGSMNAEEAAGLGARLFKGSVASIEDLAKIAIRIAEENGRIEAGSMSVDAMVAAFKMYAEKLGSVTDVNGFSLITKPGGI